MKNIIFSLIIIFSFSGCLVVGGTVAGPVTGALNGYDNGKRAGGPVVGVAAGVTGVAFGPVLGFAKGVIYEPANIRYTMVGDPDQTKIEDRDEAFREVFNPLKFDLKKPEKTCGCNKN